MPRKSWRTNGKIGKDQVGENNPSAPAPPKRLSRKAVEAMAEPGFADRVTARQLQQAVAFPWSRGVGIRTLPSKGPRHEHKLDLP
jgi:hypothetical protein